MKVKKITSLLLAVILMLSLILSGCNSSNSDKSSNGSNQSATQDGKETNGEEPYVFTVFIGEPRQQPTKDNKIYKMIEEELNVKFEFEFLVGDLDQKLGVMIAGDEFPDLIDSANSSEKTINAGALVPLQDFISEEKTPNLWRQYVDYMNMMKAEDGNVYILPNYGMYYNDYIQTSYNGPAFWLQKQLLVDMNYPEIKTLDDYFDVIADYKAMNPEINGQPTVGFEILTFDWRAFTIKNAPAQLMGNPNDGGVIVDPDTGIAHLYANSSEEAKPYYKKLNEAYHDGLIEADTFVQNYDEYIARLSTGRVLGMFDQGWQAQTAIDALISQGLDQYTWVPFGITYDENIKPWYRERPIPNYNRGFGVSVDADNPEKYIEVAEELLSDKWQKIFTWGIEGEDYLVDDDGMFYRTQEQRDNAEDVNWKLANKAEALYASLPKMQGLFDDGNAADPNSQPIEYQATLKEIDKKILDAYGVDFYSEFVGDAPENRKDYPAWQVALGDGTEAAMTDTKISELQLKNLPTLILGDESAFDASWEEYIKQYDDVNVQAYLDVVNEGLEKRRNEW
jgi:putative aldouronate transport system substrate-binding protein